ncbi:MAG: hypothetical protein KatS3mg013_1429 [Actinomycetota bacterium]|nr:MAG: hypothetical protein KatS3mg013_1429 [Actinomycetota bacterium]
MAAVRARGQDRLVVPRDLPVGLDRRAPGLPAVGRALEHDVVPVHVQGVDVAGRGDDLDDRVELPRSLARTQRSHRPEGSPSVGRDREGDPGRRAVAGARLGGVAGGQEVHVGRVRVGRDRRLPVVLGEVERPRAAPARRRSPLDPSALPEATLGLGLRERLEPALRRLGLLERLVLSPLDRAPRGSRPVRDRRRRGRDPPSVTATAAISASATRTMMTRRGVGMPRTIACLLRPRGHGRSYAHLASSR